MEEKKAWVEFRGGPYDGTMIEMREPFDGMVLYPKVDPGETRMARGVYTRGERIVAELDVFAMDWSTDVPEGLRHPYPHGR